MLCQDGEEGGSGVTSGAVASVQESLVDKSCELGGKGAEKEEGEKGESWVVESEVVSGGRNKMVKKNNKFTNFVAKNYLHLFSSHSLCSTCPACPTPRPPSRSCPTRPPPPRSWPPGTPPCPAAPGPTGQQVPQEQEQVLTAVPRRACGRWGRRGACESSLTLRGVTAGFSTTLGCCQVSQSTVPNHTVKCVPSVTIGRHSEHHQVPLQVSFSTPLITFY